MFGWQREYFHLAFRFNKRLFLALHLINKSLDYANKSKT